MSDSNAALGGCLCGKVRYSVLGLKPDIHACHCPICQKWCGGPFVGLEAERVDVEDGDTVGVYVSSEWAERVFCTACGTNLVWRLHDGGMPVVTLASLDAVPEASELASELFIDTKPAAYAFAGEHKRLTRKDVEELYGGAGG